MKRITKRISEEEIAVTINGKLTLHFSTDIDFIIYSKLAEFEDFEERRALRDTLDLLMDLVDSNRKLCERTDKIMHNVYKIKQELGIEPDEPDKEKYKLSREDNEDDEYTCIKCKFYKNNEDNGIDCEGREKPCKEFIISDIYINN